MGKTLLKKSKTSVVNKGKNISKNILLLVSFIEGGAVMIIELLGAKIIAPYYGTSLFVWSSVLGVTLGALALGYFLGGQISKKYPGEQSLFTVLLIGAFFAGIAPLIAPEIMIFTDSMGVKLGSFVSVLLYLLVPITCMGTVSPIIIGLINKDIDSAGTAAGTVYAISTVGGILATFFAGFYLIPEVGIKLSAYLTGGLLGGIALIYFLHSKKKEYVLASIILLLMGMVIKPVDKISDSTRVVYSSVGVLGEWTVLDFGQWKVKDNNQIERKLLLNGIDQTYTQIGFEPLSLWRYPHKLAAYASMKPRGSKALLLGMAGGSLAYELLAMGLELDIVELDERIKDIATTYFKYDPASSDLFIDDARHYIRNTNEKYDVVIIDLLIGEVQPNHIFSLEGFQDLKRIINEDAYVIINFQGTLYDPVYSRGPMSIYKTLEKAGFYVNYFSPPRSKDGDINFVKDIFFIASQTKHDYKELMKDLRYNKWFPYEDFEYKHLISDGELDTSGGEILVDDRPKLEQINATAILNWRKNKIEQNIRRMIEEGVPIYE
jgi:predicted membrane-bound spermidine synthase